MQEAQIASKNLLKTGLSRTSTVIINFHNPLFSIQTLDKDNVIGIRNQRTTLKIFDLK